VTRVLVASALVLAWGVSLLRWIRVAQREHYLPGSTIRFAARWWTSTPVNAAGVLAAVGATCVSFVEPLWGLVPAVVLLVGPLGLGIRGRTSPLVWTPRLRRLAVTVLVVTVVPVVWSAGTVPVLAIALVAIPIVSDAALWMLAPFEARSSRRFVEEATRRLRVADPTVVAITGSYGKTTTKGYVGRLLRHRAEVVVSPASFNNRLGLARAVNEHVTSGTQVFVAEMGTYGPGEIRDLCAWIPPVISVITAIGPVHLERFGSIEAIATAKSEIVDGATTLVLNVDYPHLESLAQSEATLRTVVRCSTRVPSADVYVDGDATVFVRGDRVGAIRDDDAFKGNVACAVGVVLALGGAPDDADLARLERPPHRLQTVNTDAGVVVIDDTYNANPAGAEAALDALRRHGSTGGRLVVVTPGMVELGRRQFEENVRFAQHAALVATDLVIVGRTNRKALLEGAAHGAASVIVVGSREEAVAWVRRTLGPGDAVVYENDLPDHYP
jgi:UDP-N-acetylmuramoyl-tripeptide--D-alanyl-D-alanine ligase